MVLQVIFMTNLFLRTLSPLCLAAALVIAPYSAHAATSCAKQKYELSVAASTLKSAAKATLKAQATLDKIPSAYARKTARLELRISGLTASLEYWRSVRTGGIVGFFFGGGCGGSGRTRTANTVNCMVRINARINALKTDLAQDEARLARLQKSQASDSITAQSTLTDKTTKQTAAQAKYDAVSAAYASCIGGGAPVL